MVIELYNKPDKIDKETIEKFEIGKKIENTLFKIVSNPKFVPLATAFVLSTVGITLSQHVISVCATKAIFWNSPHIR
jgi:hypothetical protein